MPSEQSVTTRAAVAGRVKSMIEQIVHMGGTILVAETDGRMVGHLIIGFQPNVLTGQLESIWWDTYVNPEYRRRGIGSRLMRQAEQYCRQRGVVRVVLSVTHSNRPSMESARMFGFAVERLMMGKPLK